MLLYINMIGQPDHPPHHPLAINGDVLVLLEIPSHQVHQFERIIQDELLIVFAAIYIGQPDHPPHHPLTAFHNVQFHSLNHHALPPEATYLVKLLDAICQIKDILYGDIIKSLCDQIVDVHHAGIVDDQWARHQFAQFCDIYVGDWLLHARSLADHAIDHHRFHVLSAAHQLALITTWTLFNIQFCQLFPSLCIVQLFVNVQDTNILNQAGLSTTQLFTVRFV